MPWTLLLHFPTTTYYYYYYSFKPHFYLQADQQDNKTKSNGDQALSDSMVKKGKPTFA